MKNSKKEKPIARTKEPITELYKTSCNFNTELYNTEIGASIHICII